MKITFNPANRRQREVRCFIFNPRTPVPLLIFFMLIILILPTLPTNGEMDGEIKNKSREISASHAPRTTHHVPHA